MYFHVKMSGELLNVLEAEDSTNIRRDDNYYPGLRLYSMVRYSECAPMYLKCRLHSIGH